MFQGSQAVIGDDPVFADQRNDVRDRRQGDQRNGPAENISVDRIDLLRTTEFPSQGPGDLESDAGPAQVWVLGRSAHGRVDDGLGVGKGFVGLVMVGDHQLDVQLAGQFGLGRGGDAAIDADDELAAGLGDGPNGVGV